LDVLNVTVTCPDFPEGIGIELALNAHEAPLGKPAHCGPDAAFELSLQLPVGA
jgi:hypothetical protein